MPEPVYHLVATDTRTYCGLQMEDRPESELPVRWRRGYLDTSNSLPGRICQSCSKALESEAHQERMLRRQIESEPLQVTLHPKLARALRQIARRHNWSIAGALVVCARIADAKCSSEESSRDE